MSNGEPVVHANANSNFYMQFNPLKFTAPKGAAGFICTPTYTRDYDPFIPLSNQFGGSGWGAPFYTNEAAQTGPINGGVGSPGTPRPYATQVQVGISESTGGVDITRGLSGPSYATPGTGHFIENLRPFGCLDWVSMDGEHVVHWKGPGNRYSETLFLAPWGGIVHCGGVIHWFEGNAQGSGDPEPGYPEGRAYRSAVIAGGRCTRTFAVIEDLNRSLGDPPSVIADSGFWAQERRAEFFLKVSPLQTLPFLEPIYGKMVFHNGRCVALAPSDTLDGAGTFEPDLRMAPPIQGPRYFDGTVRGCAVVALPPDRRYYEDTGRIPEYDAKVEAEEKDLWLLVVTETWVDAGPFTQKVHRIDTRVYAKRLDHAIGHYARAAAGGAELSDAVINEGALAGLASDIASAEAGAPKAEAIAAYEEEYGCWWLAGMYTISNDGKGYEGKNPAVWRGYRALRHAWCFSQDGSEGATVRTNGKAPWDTQHPIPEVWKIDIDMLRPTPEASFRADVGGSTTREVLSSGRNGSTSYNWSLYEDNKTTELLGVDYVDNNYVECTRETTQTRSGFSIGTEPLPWPTERPIPPTPQPPSKSSGATEFTQSYLVLPQGTAQITVGTEQSATAYTTTPGGGGGAGSVVYDSYEASDSSLREDAALRFLDIRYGLALFGCVRRSAQSSRSMGSFSNSRSTEYFDKFVDLRSGVVEDRDNYVAEEVSNSGTDLGPNYDNEGRPQSFNGYGPPGNPPSAPQAAGVYVQLHRIEILSGDCSFAAAPNGDYLFCYQRLGLTPFQKYRGLVWTTPQEESMNLAGVIYGNRTYFTEFSMAASAGTSAYNFFGLGNVSPAVPSSNVYYGSATFTL